MRKLFLFSVLSLASLAKAQNYTLQQCIELAQKNNLSIKQAELSQMTTKNNLQQTKAGILPTLNAGASHQYNIGRTIDRYTNTFANSNVLSQNFYASTNVTLWSGLSQYNSIKQSEYNLKSQQENLAQQKNDLALNVATAFLQVIYNQEMKLVSEQQIKMSNVQLDRTKKLVEAGSLAQSNLYDMQAQLATDEYNLTNANNQVKLALLNLQQLCNLDSISNFNIERPIFESPTGSILPNPTDIYLEALKNQHSIKSTEYSLLSAEKTLAAAKGRISPTLSFSASIGTGYSGLAKDITGVSFVGYDTTGITSGGQYVFSPRTEITTKSTSWIDQFNNNVNKSVGFQLNIPIFNGLQTSTQIKNAKLSVLNQKYAYDLNKQQLFKTIATAHTNAQVALDKYVAAQKSLEASELAFGSTEQKFNAGAISNLEFTTAKGRLLKAQADLLNAKFDFVFRIKVLDYYQGKPLTF